MEPSATPRPTGGGLECSMMKRRAPRYKRKILVDVSARSSEGSGSRNVMPGNVLGRAAPR